jgi:hypothetical protein
MTAWFRSHHVRAVVAIGCASALACAVFGGLGPVVAGLAAAAAFAYGHRRGTEDVQPQTRAKLYRVADELVQYRAFTRLLRDQGERITGQSGEAALALATGLSEIDQRITALLGRIDAGEDLAPIRAEAEAIAQPIIGMLGRLQFQDITQQQMGFLSRLSLLLDDHMEDLARLLGDRRSLTRTSRFKELFERALDDTVMTSQRNDHHTAAGIDLFEASGPKIELFGEEEPR